ncbi:MAG: hypothetical protein WCI55_07725 [Armatimonadota bacterium]
MRFFGDLKSSVAIHLKGWLFLVLAIIASIGLLIQNPSWQNLALLAIALWSACRWYYYMFYVIEKMRRSYPSISSASCEA